MRSRTFPKERRATRPKKSIALKRKVHINGEEWRWELVRSTLKILSPRQEFYMMGIWRAFEGMTPDDVERGHWKKGFHVTPANIKDFIQKKVIGCKSIDPGITESQNKDLVITRKIHASIYLKLEV